MYQIIQSGSTGNAVLYHSTILVDCGVNYLQLKQHINSLKIILLTHAHSDHFNIKTIERLSFEKPLLRFGCGDFLASKLRGVRNVDILEHGKLYDYGLFQISPIKLFHDVQNFGYRIFKDGHKTIHCTDTAHLDGIEAKGYDLYALEHNYNDETIFESIESTELNGGFAYQKGAINSHLSEQQANDFIFKNAGENYQVLRLHESKNR